MTNPAEDTPSEVRRYGWLPAAIAVVVLAISIAADLMHPGRHWTQRAGALVTVLGVYVAYVDAVRSFRLIGTHLYINHDLPYRLISIVLVIVGTVIWGYGDLLL